MDICFHFSPVCIQDYIAASYGICMFNFLRNCKLFSNKDPPFYISLAMYKGSSFSTSLPTLVIICLFDYSHSSQCELVLYVVLLFISLMTNDVEYLFLRLIVIYISSWRNVCSNPLPIFYWIICVIIIELFIIELQELFINCRVKSLTRYMICKYFLPFCALSFHFLNDVL